jgi:hypothetical protein
VVFHCDASLSLQSLKSLTSCVLSFETQALQAKLHSCQDADDDGPTKFRKIGIFSVFDERIESFNHLNQYFLIVDQSFALI